MIRLLIWVALIGAFIWFGATVNLGHKTLFGHISAIWSSEPTREFRDDVDKQVGPTVDRLERGARAGYHAATQDSDGGAGSSATPQSVTGTH